MLQRGCGIAKEDERMGLLSVIIQPFQDESTVLDFLFSLRSGLSPALE